MDNRAGQDVLRRRQHLVISANASLNLVTLIVDMPHAKYFEVRRYSVQRRPVSDAGAKKD